MQSMILIEARVVIVNSPVMFISSVTAVFFFFLCVCVGGGVGGEELG